MTSDPVLQNEKKKRRAAPWILAAVAVVLVAVAAVGAALWLGAKNDPLALAAAAAAQSKKAWEENELARTARATAEGGGLTLDADIGGLIEQYAGVKMQAGLIANLTLDSASHRAALSASFGLSGVEAASLTLYEDGESLSLRSFAAFGQDAYGVELSEAGARYADSPFGPGGKYDIGVAPEAVSAAAEALLVRGDGAPDAAQTAALAARAYKTLGASIKKNAETGRASGVLSSAGAAIPVTELTFTAAGEGLLSLVRDALTFAASDAEARAYLAAQRGGGQLLAEADRLLASPDEIAAEFAGATAEAKLSVGEENGELLFVHLSLSGSASHDAEASLVCVPTWREISFLSLLYAPLHGESASLSYDVREDTETAFAASLSFSARGAHGEGTLHYDRESGAFRLEGTQPGNGEAFVLSGTRTRGEGEDIFTFSDAQLGTEAVPLGGVTLTRRDADRMPEAQAYTELLTMSEAEADAFVGRIDEFVSYITGEIARAALAGYLSGLFG